MASEQGSNPISLGGQATNTPPSADSILGGMQRMTPGESPLDFIKKNLKIKNEEANAASNNPIVNPPTPEQPKVETAQTYPSNPSPTEIPRTEAAPTTPTPPSTPTETPEPNFEDETVEIAPEAVNFKKLRTKYKATSKTLKEREEETVSLRTKLKSYEEGEATPEVVRTLKERIEKLEPLEKIHNIKSSDAYRERIVTPMQNKTAELTALATDYGIPNEVIEEAIDITNAKDLNRFVLNNFGDEVGALEAKNKIVEIQKLRNEAKTLEKEPDTYAEKLEREYQVANQAKDIERKNKIVSTSRSAFGESLNEILSKGEVRELMPRDNDPEYNERYGPALQAKAAENYGQMVRELAELGVKDLPPATAKALSNFALYGIAGMVATKRAEAAEKYIEEMERNSIRTTKYLRPGIGGSGGGQVAAPPQVKAATTQDAARAHLESVLGRKLG